MGNKYIPSTLDVYTVSEWLHNNNMNGYNNTVSSNHSWHTGGSDVLAQFI